MEFNKKIPIILFILWANSHLGASSHSPWYSILVLNCLSMGKRSLLGSNGRQGKFTKHRTEAPESH